MSVVVTGVAGFIGLHVAQALLARGETVTGIDNLDDYYDPALKHARLDLLKGNPAFQFQELDLADRDRVLKLFNENSSIDRVVHLAAQAGVRYSLENPFAYIRSNIEGHLVVMEACRTASTIKHFVYASSSSVYGGNKKVPFSIDDRVDEPVSLYAATKCADELMTSCYSHLFDLPSTGLRFFTVYGPWGRPDMSPWLFTEAILTGKPIKVFNHGKMRRDFTYIDDVVTGVLSALDKPPTGGTNVRPHRVFNFGNRECVELIRYIEVIEDACGIEAEKIMMDMQPGDVEATWADISDTKRELGFSPTTSIEEGIPKFVEWYRAYKNI